MSITGLSNQYISQSFQGLLQVSSSGQLFDGNGNRLTLLDLTSSYAGTGNFATTGSNLFKGNQTISGSLTVTGNITAFQYIVSSSVINVTETNSSGSHIFGNSDDDTHQFTGSLLAPNMTGSLFGTASWARNSISASFAHTASYFDEADPIFVAKSGSFATTGSNTFKGNQIVSGSVIISGSLIVSSSISANSLTGSLLGNSTSATNASKIAVATSAANSVLYPTFVDTTSGNVSVFVDTELTYNPFTNTLSATSFTGSLFGTSSWARNSISSSYALTASYALNGGGGGSTFPFTGTAVITGSLLVSSSLIVTGSVSATRGGFTGSLFGTSSWALSASWAPSGGGSVGPGTVNFIPKFTTTTQIGNSIVYDDGTNVGIGTTGPTVKLDVAGEGRFNGVHIGSGSGSGLYNTRVGQTALNLIAAGSGNTAIGYNSMYNNDGGTNNTAVGYNSGLSNISGGNNVFIGHNAGSAIAVGSNNVIIGASAANSATSLSVSTIINASYQPNNDDLSGFESIIAISSQSGFPTQIWHQSDIEISRLSRKDIISLDSGNLNAAFIEYSLYDENCDISRAGYIKINLLPSTLSKPIIRWEYSEDVVTSIGDAYLCAFDFKIDKDGEDTDRWLTISLVNDCSEPVFINLSCRLSKLNSPK